MEPLDLGEVPATTTSPVLPTSERRPQGWGRQGRVQVQCMYSYLAMTPCRGDPWMPGRYTVVLVLCVPPFINIWGNWGYCWIPATRSASTRTSGTVLTLMFVHEGIISLDGPILKGYSNKREGEGGKKRQDADAVTSTDRCMMPPLFVCTIPALICLAVWLLFLAETDMRQFLCCGTTDMYVLVPSHWLDTY